MRNRRDKRFEVVTVAEALRASMNKTTRSVRESAVKTEPYATQALKNSSEPENKRNHGRPNRTACRMDQWR